MITVNGKTVVLVLILTNVLTILVSVLTIVGMTNQYNNFISDYDTLMCVYAYNEADDTSNQISNTSTCKEHFGDLTNYANQDKIYNTAIKHLSK